MIDRRGLKLERIPPDNNRMGSPFLSFSERKRNRFVLSALRRRFGEERILSSALSVLDLGCGDGSLADVLGRAGLAGVFGIDVDRAAVQRARVRSGRHGHRFETMAIEEFDSAPVFDAVVISEVLNYVSDPFEVLRSVRRWVQPGGLVVLTVPNAAGPWALYRKLVDRMGNAGAGAIEGPLEGPLGKNRFGLRSLAALVSRSGYRVEAWGASNFLCAVYPFSVSLYRPETFSFIEKIDVRIADFIPRALASGWYLSLVPAAVPEPLRAPRAARTAAGAGV